MRCDWVGGEALAGALNLAEVFEMHQVARYTASQLRAAVEKAGLSKPLHIFAELHWWNYELHYEERVHSESHMRVKRRSPL
jgi:hypothetical protein